MGPAERAGLKPPPPGLKPPDWPNGSVVAGAVWGAPKAAGAPKAEAGGGELWNVLVGWKEAGRNCGEESL